jgi:multidrug efflux system outer membrane protein
MRQTSAAAWALAAAAVLSACASAPPALPPLPDSGLGPEDRFFAAQADAPQPTAADLRWWRRFDDPALADWVERALGGNFDLQLARVRVDEARALLRGAMAARVPLLTGEARVGASNRAGLSGRRVEPTAALVLDWEAARGGALDWPARTPAAEALRSEHLVQAARLSTAALTARAYLAWREAQQAERQLADAIVLQREIARLVQVRVDAGISPQFDGLRARGELAAAEATAAAAADAVRGTGRALQQLAGERPGAAPGPAAIVEVSALPRLQGALPLTLPIDLLRLRPDLRAAEQALRAAQADSGAADAARRPTLRLPGVLTLGTAAGGALLAQLSASVAAALSAPLFDGGRLDAELEAAQARERAAVLVYRRTLQQALAQVEAALSAEAASRARIAAQQRALQEADTAVQQARALYTAGLAGLLDVLDAQRSALERRQALLRMQGDTARAGIATFEALGLIDLGAAPTGGPGTS